MSTFAVGFSAGALAVVSGGSSIGAAIGVGAATSAVTSFNNEMVAQTGANFTSDGNINWDNVWMSTVSGAVAGAAREIGSVCPPTLMQRVVEDCVDCMPDLVAYDENRNDLYNGLTGMGYECAKPDGAFYLFMKAPNGDDMAFSEAAKLEENILIVPGTGFGCPGYLRLAYCVSNETIKNSMPGFKRLIEKYGK